MGKKRRKTLERRRRRRRLAEQLGETEVKGRRRPNDAATIRRGGVRFHFKSAFDEDLSANSPGILPQVDNLLATKEEGLYDIYDSCADSTNETLNAVCPDRRTVWSIVFARDDLLGSLAGRALKLCGELRLRRLARALPPETQPISAA